MKQNPKILLIIGNHKRHLYFASTINRQFKLSGLVLVEREASLPEPPTGLSQIDFSNFQKHFKDRADAESKYFKNLEAINAPTIKVAFDKLNTNTCAEFIKNVNPDFVFVFGAGLIKSPLIEILPKETINMHLGLSPRYRGDATLFWPFYFLEPNYAGSTIHYLVDQPDAGDIIHQVVPVLERGDKIHDVACKVVIDSSQAIVDLIKLYLEKGGWQRYPQKHGGKNFLNSDWHYTHLRLVYNTFDNKIVDYFLDGTLRNRNPKIINQFSLMK